MERSPWIFMSAGLQKQAAKINKMFWAGVMSKTVSGRNWKANTVLWICPKPDMQWCAMISNDMRWLEQLHLRTHAHTVFEECQVFLKYAYFIMIAMHFLTVSSIFFIASFHHISIYIICDLIYINLRYYMLTRMDLWLIDYPWLLYTVDWCWHVDCAKHWQAGAFCSRALKAPLWTASARRTAAQRELQRVLKDNSNDLSTDSKMF